MSKFDMYDSLFGGKSIKVEEVEAAGIPMKDISLDKMHEFRNHPYKVKNDENFRSLKESIRKYGIMEPVIARASPTEDGYEIISGHRRWTAAKELGLATVPVIVVECDDDMATIMMIDGNKRREKLDPSELAFALKMRLEAERHQGKLNDTECEFSRNEIGKDFGMSPRKVSYYIRLTELLPELLEAVDSREIQLGAGFELAYLSKDMQKMVLKYAQENERYPNRKQAEQLKQMKLFSKPDLRRVMDTGKRSKGTDLNKIIDKYIPKEYNDSQRKELIIGLLEEWKKSQEASIHL